MGVLTSTTIVPAAVSSWFDRKLLDRAVPYLQHGRVAQRRPLKSRSGNTIVFRKLTALALATTPLVEGTPPAGKQLAKSDITATIQQWGDYVTLSDLTQVTIEHPILQDANMLLGEQAGQTLDALLRDVAAAGTTVFYGGGVAARANVLGVAHKVDTDILDRATRYLLGQNAKMFTEMITGTVKVSTFPIRPAFWAITHPDVIFTLQTLTGFISAEEYSSTGPLLEGEVGAYKNVRFLSSTQAKYWPGGGGNYSGDVKYTGSDADVYSILVFGRNAIASVPLDGQSLQNIIKPLGSAGSGDPLSQIATSGWKHTGARARLEETYMARIEVTAGLLAP